MRATGGRRVRVCVGRRSCRSGVRCAPYTAPVPGQMYDPTIQRAVLEKLARWRQLPEGDLIGMLGPVERLRYRREALDDLEWDGLIVARPAGDERVVAITEAGETWLSQHPGEASCQDQPNGGEGE
jgi:hypothetical protein